MRSVAATSRRQAFTLVELVLVVTIIGTIAAIAVPRFSRAAQASRTGAVETSLMNVRKAIDNYYAEHGAYPGYNPTNGAAVHTAFKRQLLMYSDDKGNVSSTYGYPYIYGPYLRPPFPRNPVNELDTVYVKTSPAAADPADGSYGWITDLTHGYFGISASDGDIADAGLDAVKAIKPGSLLAID